MCTARWLNGRASASRAEGCKFESCVGQSFISKYFCELPLSVSVMFVEKEISSSSEQLSMLN